MSYRCDLGTGQKLYLTNQGNQTAITIASSNPGQQQQATHSFTTGTWTTAPEVIQTPTGIFLRVYTATGAQVLQLQGSSLGITQQIPGNGQRLPLTATEDPVTPIKPLEPMKPMNMGNMSMSMNPMEMKMGNMSMSMGSMDKKFCPQCGTSIKPEDKFCAQCGFNLG